MSSHPDDTTKPAVVVRNLRRAYGERVVIASLNLQIGRGEFVALLGESGCGKTTLLRALCGLDAIDGGAIDGPRRPAVVFQEPRLLPWESLLRNVSLGLPPRLLSAWRCRSLRHASLKSRRMSMAGWLPAVRKSRFGRL